ncbi:integrase core domain-containing protein [Peptostreptococcus anaerobius]
MSFTENIDLYYKFNDDDKTSKESAFEKAANNLGITIKRTRPYSPWQNGKVERSHREDGKILYNRKVFTSEKDLTKKNFLVSVTYVLTTKSRGSSLYRIFC